jgi:hypothetical protein
VATLYATQADGTTENVSSALTTLTGGDWLQLIIKINGTTSVDYYWRKGATALSSAVNLTSNFPTDYTGNNIQFSVSNHGGTSSSRFRFQLAGASYQR